MVQLLGKWSMSDVFKVLDGKFAYVFLGFTLQSIFANRHPGPTCLPRIGAKAVKCYVSDTLLKRHSYLRQIMSQSVKC